jgi:iron complex outermembrane receptor protein
VYTHVTPGVQLLCGVTCPPYYPSLSELLGGITPSMSNLRYSSPINVYSRAKDQDANVDIEYRLGSLTLASTTAYQHEIQTNVQDLFAVSSFFWNVLTQGNAPPFFDIQTQQEDIKQLSQEFKLVSATDQPFSYLIGAFYSDTKIGYVTSRALLPAFNDTSVNPETKTIDLYARSTWKFAPKTSLITGVRYNHDQISYDVQQDLYTISFPPPNIQPPIGASDSSSEGTAVGDVSIQQQLADRVMAYLTYSRGYSPAAYNTAQALTTADPKLGRVQKENIDHFELGSKGSYFDNRVTLNVALFDTKYKNFQVQIFDQANGSINPPLKLTNAGGAETRGLELDAAFAPTNLTRIDLNAAYINAKFTDYNNAPCYYQIVAPAVDPVTGQPINLVPSGCFQNATATTPATVAGQAIVSNVPVVQNLTGVTMPNSPKLKFALSVEQKGPLTNTLDFVFDGNYTWRSHAQMLVDQNPYGIQGSFGILNLSAGVADKNGRYTITAFVNNVFNRVYYTDIEDFWSSPWGATSNVVGQPARDSKTFGGVRVNFKL